MQKPVSQIQNFAKQGAFFREIRNLFGVKFSKNFVRKKLECQPSAKREQLRTTLSQNNLNFRIKTEPVTADATIFALV